LQSTDPIFNQKFIYNLDNIPSVMSKASFSLDICLQLEDQPDPLLSLQIPLSLLTQFRQYPFRVQLSQPVNSATQYFPSYFFFSVTLYDLDSLNIGDYCIQMNYSHLIIEPLPFIRTNYLLLLSSSLKQKVTLTRLNLSVSKEKRILIYIRSFSIFMIMCLSSGYHLWSYRIKSMILLINLLTGNLLSRRNRFLRRKDFCMFWCKILIQYKSIQILQKIIGKGLVCLTKA
jgi:hypothetical protein